MCKVREETESAASLLSCLRQGKKGGLGLSHLQKGVCLFACFAELLLLLSGMENIQRQKRPTTTHRHLAGYMGRKAGQACQWVGVGEGKASPPVLGWMVHCTGGKAALLEWNGLHSTQCPQMFECLSLSLSIKGRRRSSRVQEGRE